MAPFPAVSRSLVTYPPLFWFSLPPVIGWPNRGASCFPWLWSRVPYKSALNVGSPSPPLSISYLSYLPCYNMNSTTESTHALSHTSSVLMWVLVTFAGIPLVREIWPRLTRISSLAQYFSSSAREPFSITYIVVGPGQCHKSKMVLVSHPPYGSVKR